MKTITLDVCLPERTAKALLAGQPLPHPLCCPVTPPHSYPAPDEMWVRLVLDSSHLPPLESPLDGDSLYALDANDIAQAIDVRSFSFEDLVEHACQRIDRPRPEPDFPFGWKDGDKTWKAAIIAGEETHPVWVAALQRKR